MEEIVISITTIFVVIIAGYFDLKEMRIPNKLTLPAIALGIFLNGIYSGGDGLVDSLLGVAVGFAWIVLFIFGALGAGDVKLFMAVGALLGWEQVIFSIIFSFFIGAVAGVFLLILRKNGKRRLMHLYRYLWLFLVTKKLEAYEVPDKSNPGYFSFGACIATGTMVAVVINFFVPLTIHGILL